TRMDLTDGYRLPYVDDLGAKTIETDHVLTRDYEPVRTDVWAVAGDGRRVLVESRALVVFEKLNDADWDAIVRSVFGGTGDGG
ncbi:MAG: hypothetical protein ACC742_17280, partial [Thermoanaerobaculales bacterium]